jgi:hypothetical protein
VGARFIVAEVVDGSHAQVWDEDFGYDANLRITGDFGSHKARAAYATAVAAALNAADIPTPEKEEKETNSP